MINIILDIVLGFIVFDLICKHNVVRFTNLANNIDKRVVRKLSRGIEIFGFMIKWFTFVYKCFFEFMKKTLFIGIVVDQIKFIIFNAKFV
jgi:hypothetical protein